MPGPEALHGERRIHRVFVTRNTEYHLRRDRCLAVRDRRTGEWRLKHPAVNRTVVGMVTFRGRRGFARAFVPRAGNALYFEEGSVMTSIVREVVRPKKETVEAYALLGAEVREARAGSGVRRIEAANQRRTA